MHSRFSFLLVLVLLTFLGGCAASGSPHAVDERGCSRFAHLFPKAAQERGIDGLTTSGFDSERYGDVLFRQLSPDFINQEPGHDIYLGENFHRTLTPQSHVFRDKDGQGFSIVHPSQKLSVRMLAVVDWNGDGVYDHATICVGRNNSGTAILDSHTRDLYHATWTNWSFKKAATIQLHGSGSASTVSGGSFKTDSNGKYYVYSDGTRIKSCFQTIKGKTYYFKSNGYVAKGLNKIGGKIYIFNQSSGVMYTGWLTYNKHKYYLGSDGAAYTEWNEIGSSTYYFDPSTAAMVTGFHRVKTKLHYFNESGVEQFGWITVSGKRYYLDKWGVVQMGWQVVGGKKYYFDEGGAMVTGNIKIDNVVYSFDANGICKGKAAAGASASRVFTSGKEITQTKTAAAKNSGKAGWVKSSGKWRYYKNGKIKKGWLKLGKKNKKVYYLDKNGFRVTGLKKIKGNRYYFNKKGVMQKGWVKIKSSWYYFMKNGKMKTGWLKLNNRYFYLQKNGKMKTGWLKDTDGKWYYLNSEGVMVTGRQIIGGKVYYFNGMGDLRE